MVRNEMKKLLKEDHYKNELASQSYKHENNFLSDTNDFRSPKA